MCNFIKNMQSFLFFTSYEYILCESKYAVFMSLRMVFNSWMLHTLISKIEFKFICLFCIFLFLFFAKYQWKIIDSNDKQKLSSPRTIFHQNSTQRNKHRILGYYKSVHSLIHSFTYSVILVYHHCVLIFLKITVNKLKII